MTSFTSNHKITEENNTYIITVKLFLDKANSVEIIEEKIPIIIDLYVYLYENKKEILKEKYLSFIIITINKTNEFKDYLVEKIKDTTSTILIDQIYKCYFYIDVVYKDFKNFIDNFLEISILPRLQST